MENEATYELRKDPLGWSLWKRIATEASTLSAEEAITATIHLTGSGVTWQEVEEDRWVGDASAVQ